MRLPLHRLFFRLSILFTRMEWINKEFLSKRYRSSKVNKKISVRYKCEVLACLIHFMTDIFNLWKTISIVSANTLYQFYAKDSEHIKVLDGNSSSFEESIFDPPFILVRLKAPKVVRRLDITLQLGKYISDGLMEILSACSV